MEEETPNENVKEILQTLTEDELLQKHKTEKKELLATIQKLKKNVNNCKKRKKEVAEEVAKLESDLKKRQEQELGHLEKNRALNGATDEQVSDQVADQVADLSLCDGVRGEQVSAAGDKRAGKVSRAAKRRAKKADAAATRESELEKEREYQLLHSPRAVEARLMCRIFSDRNLLVKDIQPDGNCLYASVSHQVDGSKSTEELRQLASSYLLSHQAQFLPFMVNPETGDLLDDAAFALYCDSVANTHAWGGQPELRALSEVLKRRIEVLQAEGSPIIIGEGYPGEPLLLAYYRHSYSLGEHYNSLTKRPVEPAPND